MMPSVYNPTMGGYPNMPQGMMPQPVGGGMPQTNFNPMMPYGTPTMGMPSVSGAGVPGVNMQNPGFNMQNPGFNMQNFNPQGLPQNYPKANGQQGLGGQNRGILQQTVALEQRQLFVLTPGKIYFIMECDPETNQINVRQLAPGGNHVVFRMPTAPASTGQDDPYKNTGMYDAPALLPVSMETDGQ